MRLIDADALFINLDGMMAVSPTGYIHGDTVADMISDAPTVDAVPVRHGKWTRHTLGSTGGYGTTVMHQCSECESMTISRFRYCPNCGAMMVEE